MTAIQLPHSNALIAISRQEAHLQSTLQHFIDAQSDGLLAGLASRPPQGETSSTGSSTPTTTHSSPGGPGKPRSIIPVRQPPKRKVGLKAARRGIARAISDLASLKVEEGRIIEIELSERAQVLSTVQQFEAKMGGLKEHINRIKSEDKPRKVEELKGEERALSQEIQELETRLWEMKAKHRQLLQEIEGLDNSVQSKLSSYQSALVLAEKESRTFIERPPIKGSMSTSIPGLWSLPVERRTLQMVRDQYADEQDLLRKRFDDVETERVALADGSNIWHDVVDEVTGVEVLLREEMREMREMQAPLVRENGNGDAIGGMRKILNHMSKARSRIASKLGISETRDWKLLICCIGAELEAMNEGQSVLQRALEAAERSGSEEYVSKDGDTPVMGARSVSPFEISARLEELGKHDQAEPRGISDRSEDEDDGPGPDLLISSDDV